ncbi:hypothetical protein CAEBREN_12877 [Caenorhabditis brenneri]|uniref:Uncharacterized protein n=1 Tax=Caenorhabditis brenneri TaxID=135651 RepID=G0P3X3_CAEBE|nr:hypothetical protein CAEBREN_12877 [Caenorhabditis brenneri]
MLSTIRIRVLYRGSWAVDVDRQPAGLGI